MILMGCFYELSSLFQSRLIVSEAILGAGVAGPGGSG